MKNRTPTSRDERPPLPPFDPVPRKPRHDGWTPVRQRAFIEALADTGSVTRAAAGVNMTPESAYHLRRQPGAESFRRAWEAALDFGVVRLKDIALERAIEGDLVPVIAGGKLHGYRRVRDSRLLMFAIRMNDRAPDGRRHGASRFQPATSASPAASIMMPALSAVEAQDAAAAQIAAFVPASLSPREQAALYGALAAEAQRRADLLPAQDPAEPFLLPEDLERAGLAPLSSPHADAADPDLAPGERAWHRLHDEAGALAIDEAVARVEAAKAAGLFLPPPGPEDGGASADAPAKAEPPVDAPLSPRTGKPKRPYRSRTPKPRFPDPDA